MTSIPTCRDVVDEVTEYLEGGLRTGERLAFERHVAICPPCRAHLAQMRKVVAGARGLAGDGISPELRAGLLDAFRDWRDREVA